jgi:hypothetical protein
MIYHLSADIELNDAIWKYSELSFNNRAVIYIYTMSSKHKSYGRPFRHQQDTKRVEPYTTKELRDSTKNAADNMSKLYHSFWAKKPLLGEVLSVNNELEVKFSTPKKGNRSKITPLSRNDYDNVVSKIRSLGFTTPSDVGVYMLRINNEILDSAGKMALMNPRTEIRGLAAIQEYCIHNDIAKLLNTPTYTSSVSMQNKKDAIHHETGKKLDEAIFHDFHFSVAYKTEEDYSLVSPHGMAKAILDDWLKSKKEFRYINRVSFTHPDYPVRIDMSIVKRPTKPNSFVSMREYTTTEARVFQADETFEIEIEVDNGEIGLGTNTETMDALIEKMRMCTKFVLMGLQETSFPISVSDRTDVGMEYLRIIGNNPNMQLNSKFHWVGPASYTLQIGNIVDNKSPDYNSTLTNIRDNYTVTDKADGERRLFFINTTGLVYLINSNMKLLFTGAKTNNKLYHNSLLDGEIISHDKHGKFINLFAAFDVYIVNGKDVRAHVFYRDMTLVEDGDDRHRNKSRHHILTHMLKDLNLVSVVIDAQTQEPMPSPIRVSVKQFYAGTETISIFAGCKKIMDRIDSDLFEYTTDGLIFTPSNLGVGAEEVGKVGPLRKFTWAKSFKWKPVVFNTVDFLVSVKKGSDNKPLIKTLYDGGMDVGRASQVKYYKTLTLMCGFNDVVKQQNKNVSVYMNPCQDVYDDAPIAPPTAVGADESKIDNRLPTSGYRPMQFFPSDPYDADGGVCNVILRPDGNGDEQMYTEENEVFEDNTIVEFRYELSNEAKWRWVPLRMRYDKTTELRATLGSFGNSYQVANSNWRSIHYPITNDMIKTGVNIPMGDDGIYYNSMTEDKTTNALCDFHNKYVKKMLITKMSRPGDTLIDLACGKGGDLSKWIDARLSFVFGVDLSKDNIENHVNGACARYLNNKKTTKTMPSALFVIGNSKHNIRKGEAMNTDKAKQITASVFGTAHKNASLGKGVEKHYGVGEDGFNVTSCQFALHYFFEDNNILHRFLRNVAECTKVGGYFIGTCYDGTRIFNMLKGKQMDDEVELYHAKTKTKLWGVTKLYDYDTFDDDQSSVGYKINVFQETINKKAEEYLVNFDYLIRVMENYGFQVLPDNDAQNLGLPSGCGLFEDLYRQMTGSRTGRPGPTTGFGAAHKMSDNEKEISFKNRYFVFKKIITVDLDKIATEEIDDQGQDDIAPVVTEIDAGEDDNEVEAEEEENIAPSMVEPTIEAEAPAPKKKRTITVRKPRKLNQSIVLQGTTGNV